MKRIEVETTALDPVDVQPGDFSGLMRLSTINVTATDNGEVVVGDLYRAAECVRQSFPKQPARDLQTPEG